MIMCSRIVHRSLSQPDVVDVRGNRHWWFVAVDQHTDFSVIAPCPSHESQAVAKNIFKHWTRCAGPSDMIGVRRRAGPGSLRDLYRKTLGVRDSGANHSSFFSVAEGSSRAKGRRHQGSGGQDDFSQVTGGSAMSVVSYEVAHALNQKVGRSPSDTSFRPVVPHPKVVEEGDELATRFIIRTSVREALEEHAASEAVRRAAATRSWPMKTFEPCTLCFFYRHHPGKRADTAMRGRYLGPLALIGPHGRSGWWVRFGGRAHLCATEHLRGITPDEADRLGTDERRQLDELLRAVQEVPENCEDVTSPAGTPATGGSSDRTTKGTGGAVTR